MLAPLSYAHRVFAHEMGHALASEICHGAKSTIITTDRPTRINKLPYMQDISRTHTLSGGDAWVCAEGHFTYPDRLALMLNGPAMDEVFNRETDLSRDSQMMTASADMLNIRDLRKEYQENGQAEYHMSPWPLKAKLEGAPLEWTKRGTHNQTKAETITLFRKEYPHIQALANVFEDSFFNPGIHRKSFLLNVVKQAQEVSARYFRTLEISVPKPYRERVGDVSQNLRYKAMLLDGDQLPHILRAAHHAQAKTSPALPAGSDPLDAYYKKLNAWKFQWFMNKH
jgi:hypothetical protein